MIDTLTPVVRMPGCRAPNRPRSEWRLAWLFLLATTIWLGAVGPDRAVAEEVLFSSIGGSSSGSISMGTSEPEYWRYAGQQFRTTYFNELTGLTLRLGNFGAAGTFDVLLYSNGTGNVPGTVLRTLVSGYSASSFLPEEALQNVSFEIDGVLSRNQDYWVVIDAGNVTSGNLQWGLTKSSTGTGVSGRQTLRNTDDLGQGWNSNFPSDYGRMEIVAVPEQGTLPLAGIGLLGAGWAIRARNRRSRGANEAASPVAAEA